MQSQIVPEDLHGIQLADYLERWFPRLDRIQLRRLVLDGLVMVNRSEVRPNQRLRRGDFIEVDADLQEVRPKPSTSVLPEVLLETASALVVAKPAGVPTVPDRFVKLADSVHSLLPELRPDQDLRIVHRLDRDTSGCLLLAKGLAAAQHFDRQLRAGAMHKEYLALVSGQLPGPLRIELLLGPDHARPGKVVAREEPKKGFREACTDLEVERTFARFCLVRLWPRTGRGHQLRVHLQAIGHPIVGDTDYGGEELLLSQLKKRYKQRCGQAERPLLQRMFLHAERLSFVDLDGAEQQVMAPMPPELQQALTKLERFAGPRSF